MTARSLKASLPPSSEPYSRAERLRSVEGKPALTPAEQRWVEENREALESSNRWVEEHGLPLEEYRLF